MKEENVSKLERIYREEFRTYLRGVKAGSIPLSRSRPVYALEEAMKVIIGDARVREIRLEMRRIVAAEEEMEKNQLRIC